MSKKKIISLAVGVIIVAGIAIWAFGGQAKKRKVMIGFYLCSSLNGKHRLAFNKAKHICQFFFRRKLHLAQYFAGIAVAYSHAELINQPYVETVSQVLP